MVFLINSFTTKKIYLQGARLGFETESPVTPLRKEEVLPLRKGEALLALCFFSMYEEKLY